MAGADHSGSAVGGLQVDCWHEAARTAGFLLKFTLHHHSRNAEEDEQCFQMCLQSMVEEITFNAGHLLAREEPQRELEDHPEPAKLPVKKLGRGFRHALTELYIHEAGRYANAWVSSKVLVGQCRQISFSMVNPFIVGPLITQPAVGPLNIYIHIQDLNLCTLI